jgi:hypothetical protein
VYEGGNFVQQHHVAQPLPIHTRAHHQYVILCLNHTPFVLFRGGWFQVQYSRWFRLMPQPNGSLSSTIIRNFFSCVVLLQPTSSAPSQLPEDSSLSGCIPDSAGFRAQDDYDRAISPAEHPFRRSCCQFHACGFWKRGNIAARGERESQMPQGSPRSEIYVNVVDILCIEM